MLSSIMVMALCSAAAADKSMTADGVTVKESGEMTLTDGNMHAFDKSMTAAGVTVRVKGQSGKMTLTVPTDDGSMDVDCQMVALRQLDASGNTLGGGGSQKHSFNSFATQEFTFSEPTTGAYGGLNVSIITFESILVGSSKVKIETMIFQQTGSFSVGSDTVNVAKGAVKFNVELSTWIWCGGAVQCKSGEGVGDSVELDLSIEAVGKGSPTPGGKAGAYSLGGGRELVMLSTYSTDDGSTWQAMPDGYPQVSGSSFRLKFPRWPENAAVVYDPVVAQSTEDAAPLFGPQLLLMAVLIAVVAR